MFWRADLELQQSKTRRKAQCHYQDVFRQENNLLIFNYGVNDYFYHYLTLFVAVHRNTLSTPL